MEVGEREAGMYDQYFRHGECGCCFHRAPLPVVALLRGAPQEATANGVRGCLPLDRPRARRFRVQILRKYGCALGHAASLARVTYARTRTPGRPAAALAPHLPGAARLRREIEAQLAAFAATGLRLAHL